MGKEEREMNEREKSTSSRNPPTHKVIARGHSWSLVVAFARPLYRFVKRRQVPIESGFAMTVYKTQGQTMSRVVVDLAGCSGTFERPYVM